jgi:exosortase
MAFEQTTAKQNSSIQIGFSWLVVGAAIVLAYWNLIVFDPQAGVFRPTEAVERLLFEPTGHRPLLMLVIVGWMVWRRREPLLTPRDAGAPFDVTSLVCFLGAVLTTAWASHVGAPELLLISLQFFLIALGGILGGEPGRRAMWFPAFVLLLAMPIPPVLLNRWVWDLQLWTAEVCTAVATTFGLAAEAYATDIVTSRGIFQVIETCAGIGMTTTLFLATVLYSELSHRSSRRGLALVLLVPVVGLAVNLVRILTIMANPYSELAGVHTTQGVVMVVVGVLSMVAVDALLARAVTPTPFLGARSGALIGGMPRPPHVLLGASLLLAVVAWGTPQCPPVASVAIAPLGDLPRELFGERAAGLSTDVPFLGTVSFSDRFDRGYGSGSERVRVFAGENDRRNRRGSIVSEKTLYPGSGWQRLSRVDVQLEPGVDAELSTFASPHALRQELHWREGVEDFWTELAYNFLGLDQSALTAREGRARVFRVGAEVAGGVIDRRERLFAYARVLRAQSAALNAMHQDGDVEERTEEVGRRSGH